MARRRILVDDADLLRRVLDRLAAGDPSLDSGPRTAGAPVVAVEELTASADLLLVLADRVAALPSVPETTRDRVLTTMVGKLAGRSYAVVHRLARTHRRGGTPRTADDPPVT